MTYSRFLQGLAVVLQVAMALPVVAAESDEIAYPEKMEFAAFQPCRGSASFCAEQILARGIIDDDAAKRLEAILAKLPFRVTIAFDSPGGNLKAGLAMGLAIRKFGMDTRVAREYQEEILVGDGSRTSLRTLVAEVGCYSACAYAFMGGVSRAIEEGGQVGVHQFYGLSENGEATAQTMTAIISQYMLAMGVNRDIQDVAGLTTSDGMTVISNLEAVKYNLDNQHPQLADWGIRALDGGDTVVQVDQQQAGGDRFTRIVVGRYAAREDMLAVAVGYGPVDVTASIEETLSKLNSTPSFCVGYEKCVRLAPVKGWHYDASQKTLIGLYLMDAVSFAKLVPLIGTFNFNSDLPNSLSNYESNVELGRNGLRNAVLAIYK